jgi:hypothetical protein
MPAASLSTTLPYAPQTIDWAEDEYTFAQGLRAYSTAVATAVGVGPESVTIDAGVPASAYLALDGPRGHDTDWALALVWDEHRGWSAAKENLATGALLTVAYLDATHGLVPAPAVLPGFVDGVRACFEELHGVPVPAPLPGFSSPDRRRLNHLFHPYRTDAVTSERHALPVLGDHTDHDAGRARRLRLL